MRLILFNFIFLSFTIHTFGQLNPNSYDEEVARVFQNVNQSLATSGFLMPKALRMMDYEDYDGTALTAANKATYPKLVNLYSMLCMSKTSPNVSLVAPSYYYNFNMGGGKSAHCAYCSNV